ncbi:MAG: GGDEF domain-containing protein, partial [Clostridiales bacterium]|nr:GGDEF domain-containing protein [Clostridiales bacterium]
LLVLTDLSMNRSPDKYQFRTICLMILSTTFTILLEMTYDFIGGKPGAPSFFIISFVNYLFFTAKIIAHTSVILFLDYNIYMDSRRLKKLLYVIFIINGLNILALALNIPFQYMFQITGENLYVRGDFFIVHAIIAYIPLAVIFADVWQGRQHINRRKFFLVLMLMIPIPVGTTLDVLFLQSRLTWPVFCLSLLFAYIFLIHSDNRLDSLTGVANRRSADEYLLSVARNMKSRVYSIIAIDMDDFKQINDTFGHATGDAALIDAAAILKMSARHTDFVARTGGDEFLIVVPDNKNVEYTVDRIQKNLADFNVKNKRLYTPIKMSMGYTLYTAGGDMTMDECLSFIDNMMYKEKNCRRGSK